MTNEEEAAVEVKKQLSLLEAKMGGLFFYGAPVPGAAEAMLGVIRDCGFHFAKPICEAVKETG